MPVREPQMYAVIFTGSDGDHLAQLTLTKRNTAAANRHAQAIFRKLTIKDVKPVSGPEEIETMKAELLAANPSRVPIDELTDGVPNRVLHEPEVLDDDN